MRITLQLGSQNQTTIPLSYLGFGVFLLWGFSIDFTDFFVLGSPEGMPRMCYFISSLVNGTMLVVMAMRSRAHPSLLESRRSILLGAALGSIGSLVMILAGLLTGNAAPLIAVIGAVGAGAAMCLLALEWMELYSEIDQRSVIARYASSLLVFGLGGMGLAILNVPLLSAATVVALPAISGWGALCCRARREGEGRGPSTETLSNWSFPIKPVILIVACTVASRVAKVLAHGDVGVFATSGDLLVAAAVLAVAVIKPLSFDIRGLYRWALPLCAAGLLLGICNIPLREEIVAITSNAGFSCIVTFVTVLLCSMSYRYGINPLWLFGFSRAARVFAGLISTVVSQGITQMNDQAGIVITVVATLALIVCFMLALTESDYQATWGMTPRDSSSDIRSKSSDEATNTEQEANKQLSEQDVRTLRLTDLRRSFGLTPREVEVTELLVQGAGIQQIESQLVISNGTLRVHLRHIYAKCGVHSREELLGMYDQKGPSN